MGIVERVRMLCEQNHVTFNKVESATNIGRGNIARWDAHKPGSDKVQKVADYFGVSVEYILTGEDKKIPVTEVTGLTESQIKLLELLPQLSPDAIESLLQLALVLVKQGKSQDGQ